MSDSGSAGAITVSGQSVNVPNPSGKCLLTLEILPTGGPSSLLVAVDGHMRGGTTPTDPLITLNNPSASILPVVANTPYDYFEIQATWTGGTNVSVTINYLFGTT